MIWSGQTASLANLETPNDKKEEVVEVKEEDKDKDKDKDKAIQFTSEELDNIFAKANADPDEEDNDTDEVEEDKTPTTQASQDTDKGDKQKGRKVSDVVTTINQMVKDQILDGFQNEQGEVDEIKTIEEAKELIRANITEKEKAAKETFWKEKVDSYSPQIRAILHYAENGGGDVTPLLSAISQVEETLDLDETTAEGQEAIVREVLKMKGFDNDEINDQVETLKDLDKLKAKAEKFLPDLNKVRQQRVSQMLAEQQARNEQAKQASAVYFQTVENTLKKDTIKDVKLTREDRSKIFTALADSKYTSLSGVETNGFVKTLEDLQFGQNKDYEHFLNIVRYTIDPQGFIDKLKESIKTDVTIATIRQLKNSKTSAANAEDSLQDKPAAKKGISKAGFKNPFA
jgi:hypothetical protein